MTRTCPVCGDEFAREFEVVEGTHRVGEAETVCVEFVESQFFYYAYVHP